MWMLNQFVDGTLLTIILGYEYLLSAVYRVWLEREARLIRGSL